MKVLYIVGGNGKGYGSEKVALTILKELRKRDVEFVVVTANNGVVNRYCNLNRIENHVIKNRFFVYAKEKNPVVNVIKRFLRLVPAYLTDLAAVSQLKQIVKMQDIDLIHTNLSRTLLGGRIARKYNIPHIWHIQEMYSSHYNVSLLYPDQIAWMNHHASRFLMISDAVKNDWVSAGIDQRKSVRIYNGIDTESIISKENYKMNCESIRIIMSGDVCEPKGQYLLIKAIAKLGENKKRIYLDIYGDGKKEYIVSLKQIINELGVSVTFKGYSDDLPSLMKEYDVGVICSRSEGFGLATLEFMTAGLCVIVSDTGANQELIASEELGFVFKRNNVDELANILRYIIEHPAVIKEKGQRARERAIHDFTVEKFAQSVFQEYESLLRNE